MGLTQRIARRLGAALMIVGVLPGAVPTGRVEVGFDQLRSARGQLMVCMTRDPDNFPDCTDDRAAIARTLPAGERDLVLPAVPAGRWAISVIHDENGNGRLDTFAGIPREGFGFSRNPRITFGPPRFDAARFDVAGEGQEQRVRLRYML